MVLKQKKVVFRKPKKVEVIKSTDVYHNHHPKIRSSATTTST